MARRNQYASNDIKDALQPVAAAPNSPYKSRAEAYREQFGGKQQPGGGMQQQPAAGLPSGGIYLQSNPQGPTATYDSPKGGLGADGLPLGLPRNAWNSVGSPAALMPMKLPPLGQEASAHIGRNAAV